MFTSSQLVKLTLQLKTLRLIEAELRILTTKAQDHSHNNHRLNSSYQHCPSLRTYSTLRRTQYSRDHRPLLGECSVRFTSDDSDKRSGLDDKHNGNGDATDNTATDISNIAESSGTKTNESVCTTLSKEAHTLDEKVSESVPGTETYTSAMLETSSETKSSTVTIDDYDDFKNVDLFLTDMNMQYTHGYTCYGTVCPKLGKLAMKKKKFNDTMYINSTSGYFYCRHCGKSGPWLHLKDNITNIVSKKIRKNLECFKHINVGGSTDEIPAPVRSQLEEATDFSEMSDDTFEIIQSIFDWHGLKKSTFEVYNVKYRIEENQYWIIFPVYSPVGTVTSVSVYSGCVLEDGDIKTEPVHRYPRQKHSSLPFGWQRGSRGRSVNDVVITSSEVNAMAVYQSTGVMGLSLQNTSQLPQEILPHLETYNKVILWLGTDVKTWENTKIFAKKLNDNRCYIFRPKVVTQMPLESLQSGENLRKLLDKAVLISHKAILTFDNLREEVYSEFAHYTQVAGVQWSRYTKLNQMLKGHRRGELTILSGPTGSGKTTFASEYSLDLCMQGVNTLWGSFEIPNVRLVKMMMQQFSGVNISKHLDEFDKIAEEFTALPMYFMTYFGVKEIHKVIETMWHAVYVHDIAHVIVDNLQFMMGVDFNETNRFIKLDQIVSEFRKFATEKNCHVTLIIHPRKIKEGEELSTASIFGSAKVCQEADNILLVQDQRFTKPSGKKYIQITKNRFDGDLGVMTLTFNKDSLTYNTVESKKKGAKRPARNLLEDETEEMGACETDIDSKPAVYGIDRKPELGIDNNVNISDSNTSENDKD